MHFGHKSRAITLLFLNEIIPLAIPYHSSPIPMSMQNLKKIDMQCICKILLTFVYSFLRYWPKMHFGHKSRAITLLFLNEIIPLAIPYHSSPIPMSMQNLKKIDMQCICKILLTFVYSFLRYWPKMHFGHKSRAITLLFLNEITHLQSPTTPLRYQCLCKIWRKSICNAYAKFYWHSSIHS